MMVPTCTYYLLYTLGHDLVRQQWIGFSRIAVIHG